jgi:probable rRNA maturation factor
MSGNQVGIAIEVQFIPALDRSSLFSTVSAGWVRAVAAKTLDHEGCSGELTIVLTDDDGIHALNRKYLGHDAPTDVLTFAAREDGGTFVPAPEAGMYLGDVIVSLPRAAEQAVQQGHSFERELGLLVIHGILHLLGYDHAQEADEATMWARQDAVLAELQL